MVPLYLRSSTRPYDLASSSFQNTEKSESHSVNTPIEDPLLAFTVSQLTLIWAILAYIILRLGFESLKQDLLVCRMGLLNIVSILAAILYCAMSLWLMQELAPSLYSDRFELACFTLFGLFFTDRIRACIFAARRGRPFYDDPFDPNTPRPYRPAHRQGPSAC